MKEFPFKTSFADLIIKPMMSEEKDKCLALASLVEVSQFIPNIDTSKNLDLLPVAFNACVVNRVNKNGDMIDTPTALAMYKSYAFKPINVEHNRQKVIGMILSAGFSEFGTDKPLTEAQASQMTTPFNITLGGVIWRIVSPELADLIEESGDPTSNKYLAVSASWELGFTGYRIALMEGGKRNLSDAQKIITDPKEVSEAENNLIALGGDGKYNDLFAYRMPSYDVLPLGIGFTEKPAAEVKGIASIQKEKVGQEELPAVGLSPKKDPIKSMPNPIVPTKNQVGQEEKPAFGLPAIKNSTACAEENQNNISQSEISNVKTERTAMKITSIKDITDESLKTCTASVISDFISTELKKGNDEWEKAKNTLNDQLAQANTAAQKAQEDYTKVQAQMKEVQSALATLNAEKAEREKVEKFNVRMSEIAASYDLDDEVRAAIVDEVKAIASDEEFTKWQNKAKVLLKGFAKLPVPAKKKDDVSDKPGADKEDISKKKAKADDDGDDDSMAKKKAKASEAAASAVDNALANAETEKAGLPNSSSAATPTMKEKYATAFARENFIINR